MNLSRLFATFALVTCLAALAFAPSAVAAPQADDFGDAGAIDIAGTRGKTDADLAGATRESGEPVVTGSNTAHTIWWRYTAAETGFARFSTCSPTGVNPVPGLSLGVYVGGSVSTLTKIDEATNNCPSGYDNAVVGPFPVTAGSYYWLQIGGANTIPVGESDLSLTLDFNTAIPANDNWANATTISGAFPQTFAVNNGLATVETGEPYSDPISERETLWWKWTAPSSGIISVDTCGSTPTSGQDSTITIFSGSSPSGFGDLNSEIDADGGCSGTNANLTKTFLAVSSGTQYWFKLSNYTKDWGFPYTLQFKWVTAPDYSDPPTLASQTIKRGNTAVGYDANWSGDPAPTVVNKWMRCDVNGANCVEIAGATNYNYVTQVADVGHTLRFRQVATNIHNVTIADSDPSFPIDDTPANNNWSAATNLGSGSTISYNDDNNWATVEIGEPSVGVNSAFNSVWYRWIPSTSGNYTINNCLGGGQVVDYLDLMIGIHTGAGPIASLTSAGSANDGCGPYHPSRTSMLFNATAGTTYWIQVSSRISSVTGSFNLSIKPVGNPEVTVQPTLSGTAEVENTLTLDMGDWISPTSISPVIHWLKCDSAGANCVDTGLAGTLFSIPLSYGDSRVKATVTLTNPYGEVTSEVLSALIPADGDGDGINDGSDACPLEAGNKPNGCPASDIVGAGVPTLSGNFMVGQTITSTPGLWQVLHDQLGYVPTFQWQRCTTSLPASCTDIPSATSSTYQLVAGDLTRFIRSVVTATNPDDVEVQSSAISVAVSAPPAAPANTTPPSVTGDPIVGEILTTTDGTWTPAGVGFDYKWLRCTTTALGSCSAIPGATASTYTLVSADLGRFIRSEVTGSNVTDGAVATSAATAVVTGDSDGDGVPDVYDTCPAESGTKPNGCLPSVITGTGVPTIAGPLQVGQTVNSSQGSWLAEHDPIGFTVDFQWQRCDTTSEASCTNISGANSDTYVLAQADYAKHIRVVATASNPDDSEVQNSAISAAVTQVPGALALPTVSGITMESETLTTTDGIWVPFDTSFTYAWLRCDDNVSTGSCTTIGSAVAATYTLTAADIGKYIRSRVTGANGSGSDSAASAATAIITADTDADNDGVDDINDDCPSEAGTKPNGCLPSVLVPQTAPTIVGATQIVNVSSSSTPGSWTIQHDQLSYSLDYQWQRCTTTSTATCSDIASANGSSYTPVTADYGNHLRLKVTASNADDTDDQFTAVGAKVEAFPENQTPPTASGAALEGATLSGTQGAWTPGDATLTNSWQRCDDATLASCAVISGETGSSYTLVATDIGKYIRFRVTGTTPVSFASVSSSPVGPILADGDGDGVEDGSDACLGEIGTKPNGCLPSVVVADSPPSLTGTFNVGQTISSDSGIWHMLHDQLTLSYGYQWQRCDTAAAASCSDIGGATGNTYALTASDYGKRVRVSVTASNSDDSEIQSSAISQQISQLPSNLVAPSVSGAAIAGSVLTADQGTWTPADATLANEWLRCTDATLGSCTAISGEIGSNYTTVAGDAGSYIRLQVTATTTAGGDFAVSSAFGPIAPDSDGDGVSDGSDACPGEAGTKPNGCLPSVIIADSPPDLTGTFNVGQTINSDTGIWHMLHDQLTLAYAYQWQRCDTTSTATCSDIPGAVSSSRTLVTADYGKHTRIRVTASNSDDSAQQFSAISAQISQQPSNSVAPSVTGTTTVGQTLTGNQGTWTPGDAALTNQWLRCDTASIASCSVIGGEVGSTYTLVAADDGKLIRLAVEATTAAGTDNATSAPTAAVITDADGDGVADGSDACLGETGTKPNGCLPSVVVAGTPPNVSGTLEVGEQLSTDDGTWSVLHDQLTLSYAYQWQRCTTSAPASCSDIPGAVSSTRTLVAADYGNRTRVRVTASNADDSELQYSAISNEIWQRPTNQVAPTVSGVPGVGDILTGNQGSWTPAASALASQWLRCDDATLGSCAPISGETGATYTTTGADLHKFIRVSVTATTPIDTANVISASTPEIVADVDGDGVDDIVDACPADPGTKPNGCNPSDISGSSAPVISGNPFVSEVISTTDGTWNVVGDQLPLNYAYQWQTCTSTNPLSCSDLSGHTSGSYTVQSSDYNHYLRVIVTASNADDSDSQASALTARVTEVPTIDSPPSFTGTERVGETLDGVAGTWLPDDVTFAYAWLRCTDNVSTASCVTISGESGDDLVLQAADDGRYIRLQVTATNNADSVVAVTPPSNIVYTDDDLDGVWDSGDACLGETGTKPNGCLPSEISNDSLPVITGTPNVGETISTSDGTWSMLHDQLTLSYSYQWESCTSAAPASCSAIPGEQNSTYTIPNGSFDTYLRVAVTASNADDSEQVFSSVAGPIDQAPYVISSPSISGTTEVGDTLTGSDGTYGPSNVAVDRAWLRCDDAGMLSCSIIAGETGSSYALVAADYQKYIVLRIHTSNGVNDIFTFSSVSGQIGAGILDGDGDGVLDADDACPAEAGTKPNGCLPSVLVSNTLPTISGTEVVGQTLSGSNGSWTVQHDQIGYSTSRQWERCDTTSTASCSAVGGQTGATYALTTADYGKYVRLVVTASNTDDSDTQASAMSGQISQDPANSVAPSISGTAMVGEVLTADQGTWTPGDATLSNVWLRCATSSVASCSPIPGATGSTYTLTGSDETLYIRLQVTGQTSANTLVVTSAATSPIAADANTDTDSDGVPDIGDTCPLEYGTKPNGCLPSVINAGTAPALSGTAEVGQTLSTTDGTWTVAHDPLGFSISYQWQRCDTTNPLSCSFIGGASSSSYTLVTADYGKFIRSVVTASNADDSTQQGSNFSGQISQVPSNSVIPSLSGSAVVGQTLSASQGSWTPADATLTNAWLRCDDATLGSCTSIGGETGGTYTLTASDETKYIRVQVTGTTAAGVLVVSSAPTSQVTAAAADSDGDGVADGSDTCPSEAGTKPNGCLPSVLVSSTPPTVSGTTNVGQTLSSTTGTWTVQHDPLGYVTSRQWERCDTTNTSSCSIVSGETGGTYALTAADYGKYIRLVVTASNSDDSDAQPSALTARISQVPVNSVAPSISGTPVTDSVITASQGTWTPGDATLSNAWLRCDDATLGSCSPIGGQTGGTYTLVAADESKFIRVQVSAMTTASTVVLASAAIGPVTAPDTDSDGVPDASDACPAEAGTKPNGCLPSDIVGTGVPTISGTLQTGSLLSSTLGTWNVLHDQLGYSTSRQWQRCDDLTTASCNDIGGETGATYTTSGADLGKHLRVVVTAQNADDTEVQASAITATAIVAAPPPVNQTLPDISGAAQVGVLLSTSGGGWTPAETVLTYEWLRCDDATLGSCTPITGATSGAYQLSAADLAKIIRVRVTGSANSQTSVAVSNPTAQVVDAPASGGGPTTPVTKPTNPAEILGPKKGRLITVRVNKKGQIYISRVSVYCTMQSSGDCSGEVKLTARIGGKTRSIGGFKLKTMRGGGRTLRIKLSSGALSHLRQHTSLSASLSVTYKSPGVSTSRYSAKVKIKR